MDLNVTRHVPAELGRDDWSAMVMHYLGLDHIGHKTGPNGPNMLPKQREMDGIVRQIYEAMETLPQHADTLLVLLGDHGMNAGGNHGGSGPGETEPALLFASPKIKGRLKREEYECPTLPKEGTEFHYYRKVEQSDVVPTIASLMGLPIPKNSLGVFIREFASLWPDGRHAVQLMHQNARQVKRIVQAAVGEEVFDSRVRECSEYYQHTFSPTEDWHAGQYMSKEEYILPWLWAMAEHHLDTTEAESHLQDFLTTAQEVMSNAASSYNIPWMVAGIALSAVALTVSMWTFPALWPPSLGSFFFMATCLLYGLMMFASSYVEEEQHLWYWLAPAWMLLLAVHSVSRAESRSQKLKLAVDGVLILAIHRLAIRWNQTGQKHAGEPDVVHAFFPDHHVLMWMLILATYGYVTFLITRRTFRDLLSPEIAAAAALVLVLPAVVFKLNFTQADAPELVQGLALQIRRWTESHTLVLQAQVFFALLALATVTVVVLSVSLASGTVLSRADGPAVRVTLAERLHHLLTIFLMMQTRAPNVPLFLGFELQRQALARLLDLASTTTDASAQSRSAEISPMELSTSALLLAHVSFFCMGGSNSISSVDLSNAYNGVANYNIVAVGVLLLASNWAGPIWWSSAAVAGTFSRPVDTSGSKKPQLNGGRPWIEAERAKLREDAMTKDRARHSTSQAPEHWTNYTSAMTAFFATSLLAVMATCTALRTHLFIWTVFSPKYLYAMAWCVGWHLVINIGLGSLLRFLGQIA